MESRVIDLLGTDCKRNSRVKQKKHNPVFGYEYLLKDSIFTRFYKEALLPF